MTTNVIERATPVAEKALAPDLPPFAAIRRQLMRRDRKTGRFLAPATFDFRFGTTTAGRQQIAISMLFAMAWTIAESSGLIMTRRAFELTRTRLRTQADSLRETTATTAQLGLHKPWPDEHYVDPVIEATREIEDRLARLERRTIVVERDRGELIEQAVAIRIAQLCRSIFGGKVMLGVVAALAGAVLDTKIERHSVRNWWAAFVAEQ
jgi:hypothetical protein